MLALKAEWTQAHLERASAGSFYPTSAAAATRIGGRTLNTLSVSMDVLF